MGEHLFEEKIVGDITGFKPSDDAALAMKMLQKIGKKTLANMSVNSIHEKLIQLADDDADMIESVLCFAKELSDWLKANKPDIKFYRESVQFPKLAMLTEGHKKKPVEDEIDFDMESGESEVEKEEKPKAPAIDKAAVLSFLKSCDAKCRADVHKKLMKMVEADKAAE